MKIIVMRNTSRSPTRNILHIAELIDIAVVVKVIFISTANTNTHRQPQHILC